MSVLTYLLLVNLLEPAYLLMNKFHLCCLAGREYSVEYHINAFWS